MAASSFVGEEGIANTNYVSSMPAILMLSSCNFLIHALCLAGKTLLLVLLVACCPSTKQGKASNDTHIFN